MEFGRDQHSSSSLEVTLKLNIKLSLVSVCFNLRVFHFENQKDK